MGGINALRIREKNAIELRLDSTDTAMISARVVARVTLRIISPGFGRTGTHSLKLALEELGFGPCHHMFEVRENPSQLAFWDALNRGETVDWGMVFEGYRSQVEWPGTHYWRDLRQHYPDAKVILTLRDADDWFDSVQKTIVPSMTAGRTDYVDPYQRAVSKMIYRMLYEGRFQGKMEQREAAIKIFNDHNAEVIATIPASQLLVFDIADGWPKLCEFLAVEVPNRPFPRSNSKSAFLKKKGPLLSG